VEHSVDLGAHLPFAPSSPVLLAEGDGFDVTLETSAIAAFNRDDSVLSPAQDNLHPEEGEVGRRTRTYVPPDDLTRKRSVNREKWKKTVAKEALDKGEAHLNVNGKPIAGKQLGESCGPSCKFKCEQRVTENQRRHIFDEYWKKTAGKSRKWDYLSRLVRHYPKNTGRSSKRQMTRMYFFRLDGKEVRVCKTMFLNTFDIAGGVVSTSLKKIGGGGDLSPDKRGKISHRREVDPTIVQSVVDHINSFPMEDSHYSRRNSTRKYITREVKSVSQMHELYQEKMRAENPGAKIASERQYRDIFNTKFNISFFVPKKDQCDLCNSLDEALKNATSEQEKVDIGKERIKHDQNNDAAQALLDADRKQAQMKENKDLCVVCFDYEKTLWAPKTNNSLSYYETKLGVNNFTVADAGKKKGVAMSTMRQ